MARFVVGISGASGIILAYRAIDALTALGHQTDIVMSRDAALTAAAEMGSQYASPDRLVAELSAEQREKITFYKHHDFTAPIASGSYHVDGTIILPCSMATLAAVAIGMSDNLIRRVGDIALKERRRLVIVPRETPFSEVHLENMLKITRMGGIIVPPIPAWYTFPETLADVENFIVGRALDLLGVMTTNLYPRWGSPSLCEKAFPKNT